MPSLKSDPSYFLFLNECVPVGSLWQLKEEVAQQHCQHGAQLCHGQGLANAVPGTATERVPAAVDATAVAFWSSFWICYRHNGTCKSQNLVAFLSANSQAGVRFCLDVRQSKPVSTADDTRPGFAWVQLAPRVC